MCENIKIYKCLFSNQTNMDNFHLLEVGENLQIFNLALYSYLHLAGDLPANTLP